MAKRVTAADIDLDLSQSDEQTLFNRRPGVVLTPRT
tara:strand:- start:649 stop:756 length:108 start_codon:yes stop_codon:yes gene_type:complete